jgi:hypothetical protein
MEIVSISSGEMFKVFVIKESDFGYLHWEDIKTKILGLKPTHEPCSFEGDGIQATQEDENLTALLFKQGRFIYLSIILKKPEPVKLFLDTYTYIHNAEPKDLTKDNEAKREHLTHLKELIERLEKDLANLNYEIQDTLEYL